MSDVIPARLVKLKPLADVPRHEFTDRPSKAVANNKSPRTALARMLGISASEKGNSKRNLSSSKPQRRTFNAAVWLRFLDSPKQPVSMWLLYRDDKGEFAVMVDQAKVDSGSTMLSGCVTIPVHGQIEYMKACCSGLEPGKPYTVEELYVQRHASNVKQQSQNTA